VDLEKRVEILEQKIAALEGQIQKQPEEIILEIDGKAIFSIMKGLCVVVKMNF